jgi:kinesin family protein C1
MNGSPVAWSMMSPIAHDRSPADFVTPPPFESRYGQDKSPPSPISSVNCSTFSSLSNTSLSPLIEQMDRFSLHPIHLVRSRKKINLSVPKSKRISGKPRRIETSPKPVMEKENEDPNITAPSESTDELQKKIEECKQLKIELENKDKEMNKLRESNRKLQDEVKELKKQLQNSMNNQAPVKPEVKIVHHVNPVAVKRSLMNVINVKDRVKLYCRVRPFTKSEEQSGKYMSLLKFNTEDEQVLEMFKPITTSNGVNNETDTLDCSKYIFKFDKVYQPTAQQDLLFEDIKPSVESVITEGYRVTLFAYGQTGSGKTFTIQGPAATAGYNSANYKTNAGMLHRSVEVLMDLIDNHNEKTDNDTKLSMQLSCVEVYNEEVRDLLNQSAKTVYGEYENVKDLEHLTTLLDTCTKNRTVSATQANERSSRSHCLFRFRICRGEHQKDSYDTDNVVGVLNLIDLAGSERMSNDQEDTNKDKQQKKHTETKSINSSLYALSQVIKGMVKGDSFINYRSSRLTKLLKPDLVFHNECNARSKIMMFVNIRPPLNVQDKYIDKTISSLQFAKEAHTFDIVKHKVTC